MTSIMLQLWAAGMRTTMCTGIALLLIAAFAPASHAQAWRPDKAIDIVVGTTPGGPQDRQGRLMQRIFQERKLFDQTSSVSNRPGGGGGVALAFLAQHKGDAHFMQIVAQSLLSNHIAGRSKLHYSDFSPLAILGVEYVVLVTRADSPIKDAREFLDNLRKNPAAYALTIGTAPGNGTHTAFAHAMKVAGVDIRRLRTVGFSSAGEGMTAVMGGHLDAGVGAVSTVIAHIRSGKLRPLAIGAPRRWDGELANTPIWKELGVDSAQDLWRGLAGPPGLTPAQIAFWDQAISRAVKDGEWLKDIERNLMANAYKNSADTLKHWQTEYAEVKVLFTEMGLAK